MQLLCSFFDHHPSSLAVPTWKFGVQFGNADLSAVWLPLLEGIQRYVPHVFLIHCAIKSAKQNVCSASSYRRWSKTDKNHQRLPTGEHSQRLLNGTTARNETLGLWCAERYRLKFCHLCSNTHWFLMERNRETHKFRVGNIYVRFLQSPLFSQRKGLKGRIWNISTQASAVHEWIETS